MGVKLGLLCWRTNTGWRYLRMGWWGRYFNLTWRKWQEDGKFCLIMMFMTHGPQQMLFVFIKWSMTRRGKHVSHTRWRESHIAFWLGDLKKGAHFGDRGADGRIILKLIFKKYYQRFWLWLTWIRIDTNGCKFWTWWWIFRFREVPGLPWLAEEIAGSEEGLCCMEFKRTPILKALILSYRGTGNVFPTMTEIFHRSKSRPGMRSTAGNLFIG